MPTKLTTEALANATYKITAAFTDASGNAVTPDAGLNWTLKDDKGATINSRSAVAIAVPAASVDIVLSGADLATQGVEDNGIRILYIDGQYDAAEGSNLPLDSSVMFVIDVLLPVSLREIKEHCRIDHSNDDVYLAMLTNAARIWVEKYLRRKLLTQTCTWYLDDWPDGEFITLPYGNLQSVTSIKYRGTDGTWTTWSATEYIVETGNTGEPSRVVLAYGYSWPSTTLYPSKPIQIIYSAGYGADSGDVPEPVKQAIKIKTADLYENREDVLIGQSPSRLNTAKMLMDPFRIFTDASW